MTGLPKIAVSACLLGECCTYKATHNKIDCLEELKHYASFVPVCPETQGGLEAPRLPAEIQPHKEGESVKVLLKDGTDVTYEFVRGAEEARDNAVSEGCEYALLKERSPSCGFGSIYDGSFTGVTIVGNGLGADFIHKAGIPIYGESRVDELIQKLKNDSMA